MNTKSNLALAIETTELFDAPTLNAAELEALLRLGNPKAAKPRLMTASRGRRGLVSFKDNHSELFRPFRVY